MNDTSRDGASDAPLNGNRHAVAGSDHAIHVGLALSGGASKAVAHVGVIKALEEAGIVVDAVAGTSGGAIVAALYASGMSGVDLEKVALSLSWKTMAQVRLSRLGFLSSDRIERFVVSTIGDITFDQLRIPLAVVTTNLDMGARHVFREGRVALACRASCSIPQIYKPVEIDGRLYVDGGMIEDLPLASLAQLGPPLKVGVNLAAGGCGTLAGRPRHFLHLAWNLGIIVSRQNAMSMEALGDVVIRPQLQAFSSLHFRQIAEMIDEGYRSGLAAVPAIHAAWAARTQTQARARRRFPLKARPRAIAQRPITPPPIVT